MLTDAQLKEALQTLAENKFRLLENDDLSQLIPAMLRHIGSIDPILRDDLIYSAFAHWILYHNAITPDQMREIARAAIDEQHLLYKIGEQGTDSVFTRSFSALLIPLLLIAHRKQPYLSAAEVGQVKQTLLFYMRNEKDHRGYVDGKGWAHAAAHGSDALDDLAQCVEVDQADLAEILDVLRGLMCASDTGYVYLEDERAVIPVLAVIHRQLLSDDEITQWIDSFAERALAVKNNPERLIVLHNVKGFLQSLYFRLQWEDVPNNYAAPINAALRKINPFVQKE